MDMPIPSVAFFNIVIVCAAKKKKNLPGLRRIEIHPLGCSD
jgi:hypothetical protein